MKKQSVPGVYVIARGILRNSLESVLAVDYPLETQILFTTEGSLKQATRMILLPNNRTSENFSFIHASNKVDSIPTQ